MSTDAETHLRAGRPDEAMVSLRDAIRRDPANAGLRQFLYQLLALNGQWEKALNQLQVVAGMLPEGGPVVATLYGALIRCEGLRAEVFAGKKSPLLFGEPEPWMGELVEANRLLANGDAGAAVTLRGRAFESAPTRAGRLDGQPFAWLADADGRLGPMLEAMLDGKYYWIPFSRISRINLPAPTELRDLIWAPAHFTWANGGASAGFVPTRYPGTEIAADGPLRLGRATTWAEPAPDLQVGLGQRVWATDADDHPFLSVRAVEFNDDVPA